MQIARQAVEIERQRRKAFDVVPVSSCSQRIAEQGAADETDALFTEEPDGEAR